MTSSPRETSMNAALKEKARLESSTKLHWFHWLIILASLVLTLGAWAITKTQHQRQIEDQFEREAAQVVDLLTERMREYETVLSSAGAALEAKYIHNDHKSWRAYALSLDVESKYPGINGIGVIDHLPRQTLEAYLEVQRKERPDFKIHPPHAQDELFPIVFIEPVEINGPAVGLDMAHENNRYSAAKKSRDSGTSQITGPIILVQDSKRTPGFLFFLPVYSEPGLTDEAERREKFIGLVYAPFIVHKLMRGTLKNENRHVALTITDGGTALFDESNAGAEDIDPNPMFMVKKSVDMYGRTWTFDVQTKRSFNRAAVSNKPQMILIGGLAIEALLVALFLLLARSNRNAVAFAGRMVAAQKADAARLNSIIDNTVDGMMTTGQEKQIKSFNKACEQIFGYPAEDVIGQDLSLLFPDIESYTGPSGLDGDVFPSIKDLEVKGKHKNGTSIPLEVSASVVDIDGKDLFNIITRDISLRKEAEAKLQKTMDDLMASNEQLERFAYVASHDLKSPLRGIDNLSQWLEEDLDAVLDDENRARLGTLRGRVSRMDNLLNALLKYSRIGYDARHAGTVNLVELVENVWDMLDAPKGFKLEMDKSLERREFSQMPLEQILHNLIGNALKHHGADQGIINLSCREVKGFYEFSVTDNGRGIAPEFHEKIFEMFQTLRARDAVEGSGMGLAFVKKMVTRYGGDIWLDSEPGQGSCFIFTLPI